MRDACALPLSSRRCRPSECRSARHRRVAPTPRSPCHYLFSAIFPNEKSLVNLARYTGLLLDAETPHAACKHLLVRVVHRVVFTRRRARLLVGGNDACLAALTTPDHADNHRVIDEHYRPERVHFLRLLSRRCYRRPPVTPFGSLIIVRLARRTPSPDHSSARWQISQGYRSIANHRRRIHPLNAHKASTPPANRHHLAD